MTRLDASALGAAPRPTAERTSPAVFSRWPLWVHLGSLAAAAVFLVLINRNQWFFYDEFMFLGYRRDRGPSVVAEYLAPHYGHWSTVPLALYQLLRERAGLRSYWPYLLPLLAVHLGATHLIWRFSQRLGGSAWVATGLAAVFAVLGAGWENLVWAFQVGSVGSVLLGVTGLLLVTRPTLSRPRWWSVSAVLLVNLATSGVGLVFLVTTVVVTVLWHGRRAALVGMLPSLVYAVWLACFGGNPSHDAWPGPLWLLPVGFLSFIGTGLTASAAHVLGNSDYETKVPVLLGSLPLVAFCVATYRTGKHGGTRERTAGAVAAGAVLFYALCGVARVGLGPDQARAARYTYLVVALCLPALAVVFTRLVRRGRWWGACAAMLCVVAAIANAFVLAQLAARLAVDSGDTRRTLFAAVGLAGSGAPIYGGAQLEPTRAPSITLADVRTWQERGLWPVQAFAATPTDLASASLSLQVRVVPAAAARTGWSARPSGCHRVDNHHPRAFHISKGDLVTRFTLTRTQHVGLHLTTADGVSSRWRVDELKAGTWAVQTLLPGGTLDVVPADDAATTLVAC